MMFETVAYLGRGDVRRRGVALIGRDLMPRDAGEVELQRREKVGRVRRAALRVFVEASRPVQHQAGIDPDHGMRTVDTLHALGR